MGYSQIEFLFLTKEEIMDKYKRKYILNDSRPSFPHRYGGLVFSHLVALPEERRHLKHKMHEQPLAMAKRRMKAKKDEGEEGFVGQE
ncbi:hypothetical protein Scep_003718 [Stephania cephalantha]|uniref:Uncharacterized protein n=1 Tax=Stephania cephalantha TaxID=152367 RepID=A0AAP0KSM7_9MAGN